MIYVLYCLYSTWGYLGVLGGGADLIILVICTFWGGRGGWDVSEQNNVLAISHEEHEWS